MNRSKKRRRTLRPSALIVLLILCALVVAAVLLLISSQSNSPEAENTRPDVENHVADAAESGITLPVFAFGDHEYLEVSKIDGFNVELTADFFAVARDPEGNEGIFFAGTCEYVLNGKLYLSKAAPQIQNNALYLEKETALSLITQLSPGADEKNYACGASPVFSANAAVGLALPEGQDAQSILKLFCQTPEYKNAVSAADVDLPDDLKAEYLRLVNVTHPLGENYVPTDLEIVKDARYGGENAAKLRVRAANSLNLFLTEAKSCGYHDVSVTSGYRSYIDQSNRFQIKVNSLLGDYSTREEAEKAAATEIQYPGKSEHQSGLACDMHNLPSADTSFGDTEAGKWLAANAYKFGFILRYPADKTEITGISYEPWHFRYVGRYHATRMFYLNLTLEEYTDFLESNQIAV